MSAGAAWSAVVVTHDAGALLERCVASLLADTSAGAPPEVVVVDSGSADGSADALARARPEVRVVQAPGNVGYARGANLGIAATRSDVVAVLNPDVEIEPGTAAAVLGRFAAEPGVGAVGPRIINPDGTTYPSARRFPSAVDAAGHGILGLFGVSNRFTRRYRQADASPDEARIVDWVSGAAIWLRRSALDRIGGWDERYFLYVEDLDLGWRLGRAGWLVVYEPAGRVVHVQGASTRRHPYRMIVEHHRSAWRFARVRYRGARAWMLVPSAIYLAVRAVAALARHAAEAARDGGVTGSAP